MRQCMPPQSSGKYLNTGHRIGAKNLQAFLLGLCVDVYILFFNKQDFKLSKGKCIIFFDSYNVWQKQFLMSVECEVMLSLFIAPQLNKIEAAMKVNSKQLQRLCTIMASLFQSKSGMRRFIWCAELSYQLLSYNLCSFQEQGMATIETGIYCGACHNVWVSTFVSYLCLCNCIALRNQLHIKINP